MSNKIEFTLTDYDLEISETKRLSNRGIFVFRNLKTSQLLYVRLASDTERAHGGFWEMVSSKEMRELHIQESYIEESYNRMVEDQNEPKEQNFEESAQGEPTETDKKVAEAMAEQKRKMNDPNSKTLKIVVENATRTKEKTDEEIKAENEDLKSKLAIIAEMELAKRKKALGLSPEDPMTGEQLRGYEKAIKDLKSGQSAPAGSASLEGQLASMKGSEQGFSSYEEMFAALHKAEREGNSEATAILNELTRKVFVGHKKRNQLMPEISGDNDRTPISELVKKKGREKRAENAPDHRD